MALTEAAEGSDLRSKAAQRVPAQELEGALAATQSITQADKDARTTLRRKPQSHVE